jgi:predicted nucleotidyltransferase
VTDETQLASESLTASRVEVALSGYVVLNEEEVSGLGRLAGADTLGLMLYGSRARGDFTDTSDVDILRLSRRPSHTYSIGRISVSSYTPEQLESASGTLFGTHLVRDGVVLFDPTSVLSRTIARLTSANPTDLISRVRDYSIILDQPLEEQGRYVSGLVRLARYLLRTATYAHAMLQGRPCFSVRELADRFAQPELVYLLSSHPDEAGQPTLQLLADLKARLENSIGQSAQNPWGSLAALAVATWESDRIVAALTIRAMSEDSASLSYTDLPKVLL